MKNLFYLLILAIFLFGCSNNPITPTTNDPYKIKLISPINGDTVSYYGLNIDFVWHHLHDSTLSYYCLKIDITNLFTNPFITQPVYDTIGSVSSNYLINHFYGHPVLYWKVLSIATHPSIHYTDSSAIGVFYLYH